MSAFAYSFCIALLHSIWQAALLAAGCFLFATVNKKLSSQAHKNLLLLTISTQALLFSITFVNTLFGNNIGDNFLISFTEYLPHQNNAALLYQWIFIAYACVVLIKTSKTIYQWQVFKKQLNATYNKPAIDIRLFASAKALHLGIKRKVQIWYSHKISTPITFGFFKPIILLPFSLVNQITIQQTEAIILHELTHIKANDYLSNWFITIVEALFFFNPFVLVLCKKMRLQRELHCDSMVLQHNYSPIEYAEALFAAAKYQHKQMNFSLAAVSSKKQLLHRIKYFTTVANTQKNKNPFGLLLFFIVGLLFFLIVTTANVKQHQPSAKEIVSLPFLTVEPALLNTSINYTEAKVTFVTKPIATIKTNKPAIKTSKKELVVTNVVPEIQEYKLVNVANKDGVDNSQQIIIEEEQSGNKPSVMMIYKATSINGEWVLEPQMVITKSVQDSANKKIDSTLPLNKYPVQ